MSKTTEKNKNRVRVSGKAAPAAPAPPPPPETSPIAPDSEAGRIRKLVEAGQFDAAIRLIGNAQDDWCRNALGVALMRMGRYDEALQVYRRMVLQSGGALIRPDLPLEFKVNFAQAILLGGSPAGCRAVLAEFDHKRHPRAREINAAINRWSKTLPFWKRVDWVLFGIEPQGFPVPIDFAPGEFADE